MVVLIARHGERSDYVDAKTFLNTAHGKERPWDPLLTQNGRRQARKLGERIAEECAARGLPKVTKVFSSPFIRTVETAEEALLGMGSTSGIHVENGMVEALCESWFRSWAVPGADTAWGGPPHCREGVAVDHAELNPLALQNPSSWLLTAEELHTRVSDKVVKSYKSHHPVADSDISWGKWEDMVADSAPRCAQTVRRLHDAHPGETLLFITHGGPATEMYFRLTGHDEKPASSYTSLYMYLPKQGSTEDEAAWDCVITGCNKHAL